jgi:hypothetical protein
MEGEIITKLLEGLRETAGKLPDRRKAGNGRKYETADFLMSAFAVFYFQHPSMLDFQKTMEEREKRNNLRTLFLVENIPTQMVYRYTWVNGIENRADRETMKVNYLYFEMYNQEKEAVTYKNSWITNLEINEQNVENMAACACARWKIENEHNNVLKNHGDNLEHNFGHGQEHANEIFCLSQSFGVFVSRHPAPC